SRARSASRPSEAPVRRCRLAYRWCSMAEISLLLVDDHPVVRNGLRGMFEAEPGFTVLAEASHRGEAGALAAELDPDVILMDLRMPGGGGLDAITELTR